MRNNISKLVVLMAMSFSILSSSIFAATADSNNVVEAARREVQKHAIGIGLGQIFLLQNFENRGDNKITADILYTYTASHSFDLLLNFHESNHGYKDQKVWIRGYTMSIKARSYEFDSFSPFVLAGLGFYMPQIEDDGAKSKNKYTFGFNAGAGADLRLNSKIIVGLMAQFHKPFEVKQDTGDNVSGSYFKLLLTMMYLF